MRPPLLLSLVAPLLSLGVVSCANKPTPSITAKPKPTTALSFADATAKFDLAFKHINGALGKKWLPETMGSGLAWIDFDNDGWQDLFLVNSQEWKFWDARGRGDEGPWGDSSALLHNSRDGTFEDVCELANVALHAYGMGVCAGDYDNDGDADLYVTALGRNYLYRNDGGIFAEVARAAGVIDKGWSTSCAFVDYDRDGWLDLFVCHYVRWRGPQDHIPWSLTGDEVNAPSYNTPDAYTGESCRLFRNLGNGKFADVSAAAGITKSKDGKLLQGKSLGVTLCDFDQDGWIDLVVANDKEPNYLFRNTGKGGFEEVGIPAGIAVSSQGTARAAMGIHAADFGNTGREGFVIGNFTNEMLGLYENKGNGLFIDIAPQAGVGAPSRLFLSFGCFFADFDNDGWQDLFVANGHVLDDIGKVENEVTYAERPLLFRNQGGARFAEVGTKAGAVMQTPRVARGAAAADFDLDGKLEVALSQNNGPAVLLRNTSKVGNVVRLTLIGTKSNRSAIGAEVRMKTGATTQFRRVQSGSSYCSQAELPVTIGLGTSVEAEATITWPVSNAAKTTIKVKGGYAYTITEGKGVVGEQKLR